MEHDAHAQWNNGMRVEVIFTRVKAGSAQHIERHFRLWQDGIPELEGKVFVYCAKRGDEVIFESAKSSLGCVSTFAVRWYVLERYFLQRHIVF